MIGDDPELAELRLTLLSNRVYWLGLLDRHAEADTAIEETLTLAERVGRHGLRVLHVTGGEYYRRAEARLRPAGLRPARRRPRPSHGWESLTPAEAKIAARVAEGRSNPDIAVELFLSRNTVQTHVSHILTKLGARSRGEIIREVLRRMPAEQAG